MAWLKRIFELVQGHSHADAAREPSRHNSDRRAAAREPDIGEEYGQGPGNAGNAGGAGFEDDRFDPKV